MRLKNFSCRSVRYFSRVRKIAKNNRLLALSCLFVRPHGKTRLRLDGFSRNLVYECFFRKSVKKILLPLKSVKNDGYCT
jgi:hypothetical protein